MGHCRLVDFEKKEKKGRGRGAERRERVREGCKVCWHSGIPGVPGSSTKAKVGRAVERREVLEGKM